MRQRREPVLDFCETPGVIATRLLRCRLECVDCTVEDVTGGWLQGQGGVALVTHVPSASQLDSFDELRTVGKLF